MTSPIPTNLHRSAADALFDQLERDMFALTTAALDGEDGAPNQCVDEFSTEFLMQWNMPPG